MRDATPWMVFRPHHNQTDSILRIGKRDLICQLTLCYVTKLWCLYCSHFYTFYTSTQLHSLTHSPYVFRPQATKSTLEATGESTYLTQTLVNNCTS